MVTGTSGTRVSTRGGTWGVTGVIGVIGVTGAKGWSNGSVGTGGKLVSGACEEGGGGTWARESSI